MTITEREGRGREREKSEGEEGWRESEVSEVSKSVRQKRFPPIIYSSLIIIHASFDFHLVGMS